ncbi:gp436 family protein [Brucella anthropi]|uniref:gp436 family protein n=1 Tax=Brucella anthropi TaxID=529 RepID=UPI00235E2D1F|nr:DUF1320 domain-containing protein [Brucella anthropi]
MNYATKDDIEDLWGDGFVQSILPEDVDVDEAIASALDFASRDVDGYLSARYPLPLPTCPVVLKSPTVDIAVYKLANRHVALTNTIEDRYKYAIRFLERLADGKAGLGVDEPRVSSDPTTSSGGAAFSADSRLFTRDSIP